MEKFEIEVSGEFFQVLPFLEVDLGSMKYEVLIDNRKMIFGANESGNIVSLSQDVLMDKRLLSVIGHKIESYYL